MNGLTKYVCEYSDYDWLEFGFEFKHARLPMLHVVSHDEESMDVYLDKEQLVALRDHINDCICEIDAREAT